MKGDLLFRKLVLKPPSPILTGHHGTFVWIRPDGRGTFLESPAIKSFVEAMAESKEMEFVVDLEACPGMDSTFMGMLAGLGIRFRKSKKGKLVIVGTSSKTKASLKELGLQYLSTIEPETGLWEGKVDEIRAGLTPLDVDQKTDRESHVLECHENLCEADEANLDRFKTVLEMMDSDLVSRRPGKPDSAH